MTETDKYDELEEWKHKLQKALQFSVIVTVSESQNSGST